MFYKTQNGARFGDLFMSLIHTCELNGVNALDYLQALTEHAAKLAAAPKKWLPWAYRDTVAELTCGCGPPGAENARLHAYRRHTLVLFPILFSPSADGRLGRLLLRSTTPLGSAIRRRRWNSVLIACPAGVE